MCGDRFGSASYNHQIEEIHHEIFRFDRDRWEAYKQLELLSDAIDNPD